METTPWLAMRIPDPIPGLKVQVARAIVEKMDGWSQEMAAEILRTDQPRMSTFGMADSRDSPSSSSSGSRRARTAW